MKYLYIFNPEHDLALANGNVNYEAPLSARKFAKDLSCLPLWYAEEGDSVVASQENQEWKLQMERLFPVMKTISLVEFQTDEKLLPWGWNFALRKNFDGINDSFVENVASHSHRRWSIVAMKFLHENLTFQIPIAATELFDRAEVDNFIKYQTNTILKAPISGSGRGVWRCFGALSQSAEGWCQRIFIKQGSVMAEPLYDKVQDFAMEFCVKNGKATFCGYSLFETEAMGVYSSNILASDTELEHLLTEKIPLDYLQEVKKALLQFLEQEYSFYEGYLGVDMLLYKENDQLKLNPMVEINLRMTMGLVARKFFDRFVARSSIGVFKIKHFKDGNDLQTYHQEMQLKYPLQLENNRISSGYLSLCPINSNTQYCISVEISNRT